uniref:CxC2 domain-containing protein n=1 Tax=Macrostomum lignano TaxID=282301 RepID=A0A1I8GWH1_9PLAT
MVFCRAFRRNVKSLVAGRGKRTAQIPVNVAPVKHSRIEPSCSEKPPDDAEWLPLSETETELRQEHSMPSSTANHSKRVEYSNEMWNRNRDYLLNAFGETLKARSSCELCGASELDNIFRCTTCHLSTVCHHCLQLHHRHRPLHVVEKW